MSRVKAVNTKPKAKKKDRRVATPNLPRVIAWADVQFSADAPLRQVAPTGKLPVEGPVEIKLSFGFASIGAGDTTSIHASEPKTPLVIETSIDAADGARHIKVVSPKMVHLSNVGRHSSMVMSFF